MNEYEVSATKVRLNFVEKDEEKIYLDGIHGESSTIESKYFSKLSGIFKSLGGLLIDREKEENGTDKPIYFDFCGVDCFILPSDYYFKLTTLSVRKILYDNMEKIDRNVNIHGKSTVIFDIHIRTSPGRIHFCIKNINVE